MTISASLFATIPFNSNGTNSGSISGTSCIVNKGIPNIPISEKPNDGDNTYIVLNKGRDNNGNFEFYPLVVSP